MEDTEYDEIIVYKQTKKKPNSLKTKNRKDCFVSKCRHYSIRKIDGMGVLFLRNKPVLRRIQMNKIVEEVHGKFHKNRKGEHRVTFKRLEQQVRKRFELNGLRKTLLHFCQLHCEKCDMTYSGTQWFSKTVKFFNPPNREFSKRSCEILGLDFKSMPQYVRWFKKSRFSQAKSTQLIPQDGNCVFRALVSAIGGDDEIGHIVLRSKVFQHLESIKTILQKIYKIDMLKHSEHEEQGVGDTVCGIVIHAAASLLKVDILCRWRSDDGVDEWQLCLGSLEKSKWQKHQIALMFSNFSNATDHVDLILEVK